MKKICIIVPKGFPVPATKGGAIESLMTDVIDQNEKTYKTDITVVSVLEEEALSKTKKYNNTKFVYIDTHNLKYKIKALKVRLYNLFGRHQNTYNEVALDKIKKLNFDYIVVEDGAFSSFRTYLKYFKKEQMILHFHHNGISDKYTDQTFDKFLGVSQFVVDTFSSTSCIKKCFVVKNGINISKFQKTFTEKQNEELRKKLGFKKDDFVVVFCGRLIPGKGVLELARAIKNIKNDKIKLMIIGSINFGIDTKSEYLAKLEEEIVNAKNKIKLTGYIDNKEIYKYYKISNLGVVPSILEDAAPLTVIEFMASGVPLIITKSGGAPEYASKSTIIIPKDKTIVKTLSEKIDKIYLDNKKLDNMKQNGIFAAKEYTTEKFYNDFIKSIEE